MITKYKYVNEIILGSVELTLDEPKVIQSLRLRIDGHAKCKWVERVGSSDGE